MIKYGLKLWSTDKTLFREALELFLSKQIDFIELYIVPDSINLKELRVLKSAPIVLHSPHLRHNFNVFSLPDSKIKLFQEQVIKTADFLKSKYIILHAGIGKSPEIFQKNSKKLYDKRILIENMPRVSFDRRVCFGRSLSQLEFIHKECHFDVCLDMAHAVKAAFFQNLNYKEFIKSLIFSLRPYYFHISGVNLSNEKDEHLDLFEGNFDLTWIKEILFELSRHRNLYLVFETPKKNGLKNDIKNIHYFKEKL